MNRNEIINDPHNLSLYGELKRHLMKKHPCNEKGIEELIQILDHGNIGYGVAKIDASDKEKSMKKLHKRLAGLITLNYILFDKKTQLDLISE